MNEQQIMSKWQTSEIVVSVVCTAYNHEKYIKDALNGFLIQKTNFPFEVLVNDDASTDNTAKILKEYQEKYPNIIKPIYHEVNEYSQGIDIFGNVTKLAKGKYIAICEGDDYWIDENKLQMQVDFLEKNPDYGMCYTRVKQYLQKKNVFLKKNFGSYVKDFSDLLKNGNRIPTLTTVFRKFLLDKYYSEINPRDKIWLMGDYPMWLYFSHELKIHFFEEITACYRILENSASHSKNIEKKQAFDISYYNIRKFFSKKYNLEIEEYDNNLFLFNFYYSVLLDKYDKNISKKMSESFEKIAHKGIKLKIINFYSKQFLLFKLFSILK